MLIAKISPDVKLLVDTELARLWNEKLQDFVSSPVDFRAILRNSRSVVSGSVALHFILDNPSSWNPGDCDVYVPAGSAFVVIDYLRHHEGYQFRNRSRQEHYGNLHFPSSLPAIMSIERLQRPDGKRIDVIESSTASALYPLPFFWSSHLVNYISADSICVTFPILTFQKRCLLFPGSNHTSTALQAKYEERGFRVSSFLENTSEEVQAAYPRMHDGCDDNPYCPHRFRFFGDEWCMQIVFDEEAGRTFGVDINSPFWRYGGRLCGGCSGTSDTTISSMQI